jgi:vanillate O-demethylase ferredoxin subunit
VLEGEPDHWDMYLTPDEQAANDRFCPCVSRSRSELLVIDL